MMKTIFKNNKQHLKTGIISIDCGLNGAIAFMTNNSIKFESMPHVDKPERIAEIIYTYKAKSIEEFGKKPIAIIEHVEGRGSDSGFTVAKLTRNYGRCEMALVMQGMKPLPFHSVSWKSYLDLNIRKPKNAPKDYKVTASMKKEKTIKFINEIYPWLEFTQPHCDAIALLELGRRLMTGELKFKKNHKDKQILFEYLKKAIGV